MSTESEVSLMSNQMKIPLNVLAINNNMTVITYARASIAALSGCTAGILGLTALNGFVFYFIASVFLSLLLFVKANFSDWKRYFISSSAISHMGIMGELTTYILFWTFIYGMVHVY